MPETDPRAPARPGGSIRRDAWTPPDARALLDARAAVRRPRSRRGLRRRDRTRGRRVPEPGHLLLRHQGGALRRVGVPQRAARRRGDRARRGAREEPARLCARGRRHRARRSRAAQFRRGDLLARGRPDLAPRVRETFARLHVEAERAISREPRARGWEIRSSPPRRRAASGRRSSASRSSAPPRARPWTKPARRRPSTLVLNLYTEPDRRAPMQPPERIVIAAAPGCCARRTAAASRRRLRGRSAKPPIRRGPAAQGRARTAPTSRSSTPGAAVPRRPRGAVRALRAEPPGVGVLVVAEHVDDALR